VRQASPSSPGSRPRPKLASDPVAYTVVIQDSASKALRKLDKPVRERVAAAIDAIADDPRPAGIKAIVGEPGAFRIRVPVCRSGTCGPGRCATTRSPHLSVTS
jgi:mRNA interferase RelE/StbE